MTHRRGPAGAIRPGLLLSGDAAKKVVHQRVNKLVRVGDRVLSVSS
jgi:hypothetical protein